MFDSKKEASYDYFSTAKVIFMIVAIILIFPILGSKDNAINYIAINLFPEPTIAKYLNTKVINEFVIERNYGYLDLEGNSHIYNDKIQKYHDKEYLNLSNNDTIDLLYSKHFPKIAYPKIRMLNIKGDFNVFIISFPLMILCLVLFVYAFIKLYKLNKLRDVTRHST